MLSILISEGPYIVITAMLVVFHYVFYRCHVKMWRSSRSFHKLLLHGGAHSIVTIRIPSLMSDRASKALAAASLLGILKHTNQY